MAQKPGPSKSPNEEIPLEIGGMTCASCVTRVEKALSRVPGVVSATVNLATESANIIVQGGRVRETDLIASVQRAGYDAKPKASEKPDSEALRKAAELQSQFRAFLFSAILSLPLLLPMVSGHRMSISPWVELALATPVQFYFGARFYRGAFGALRALSGNMDLLVALGTSAAYALSLYFLLFAPHPGAIHTYFESSALVITLVLLGKWLEARAKYRTTEAIRALQALRPDRARVLRPGNPETEVEVALDEIRVGDLVLVRAGERIPVDGVVLEGRSQVNESMVTGESMPVPKDPGSQVIGGSVNLDGLLRIRTRAIGGETMLAKIIRLVESAQAQKPPVQRLVDQVSAVFVPIVVVIAIGTFFGSHFSGLSVTEAMIRAVAVLVIACPCALGLATPTSIMVGTGIAARHGILIQDPEALELAHAITTVAFDKTGTLTEGRPELVKIVSTELPGEPSGEPTHEGELSILGIAAAIQTGNTHPLAEAVLRSARDRAQVPPSARHRVLAGLGAEAEVSGRMYRLGSKRLMEESSVDLSPIAENLGAFEKEGLTLSILAEATPSTNSWKAIGAFCFQDRVKATSRPAIERLRKLGIETVMLTGDNRATAARVASDLGISRTLAEILPSEKSRTIETLKGPGKIVAMVGDGINDAPALAAADIGLAMATGTDVAMQVAGVTLMRGDPLLVPQAIDISRRTFAKIRQNLFWAFIYNIIGIPLAAMGFLSPVIAGGAMALSSFSVVTNALLLSRWRPAR